MGAAALLLPETWPTKPSVSDADRAALEELSAQLRSLLEDVRRDPPPPDSEAERVALVRMSVFGLSVLRTLGTSFLEGVRSGVNGALADLVKKELEAAETERKLALRHIERAVETYGVLMESLGAAFATTPPASAAALLDELTDHVRSGQLPLSETDRLILRFQLDVMVALEVLEGPLDELTRWASRAVIDSRRIQAMPGAVSPSGLRGELARVRARRSWVAWDDAELAKELAPWPTPSR